MGLQGRAETAARTPAPRKFAECASRPQPSIFVSAGERERLALFPNEMTPPVATRCPDALAEDAKRLNTTAPKG